jgi:6-phosphogluconolactonase
MRSVLSLISEFKEHGSLVSMGGELAKEVASVLAAAIAARGAASLAVSGGSTPKVFYELLSEQSLDWSKVTIVLVDERWVEPGKTGSNETFVRSALLQGEAARARLVGLKSDGETPWQGLSVVEARVGEVSLPFDVVVLGMGLDGHTASWFPRAQGLDGALATGGARVAAVKAAPTQITGPFAERITLTRGALSGTSLVLVLLKGDEKRRVWEVAQGPGRIEDMPIRALIRDPDFDLSAHWAP